MKTYALLAVCLFLTILVSAQITRPKLSQRQTLEQKIGFTEVTIEYSRPAMRGREIFGGLEPYGEVWRTGANRNSHITFSAPVQVDGTTLAAGTYTLFTRPEPDTWTVYFYPYDNEYGVPPDFSEDKAMATVTVPVFELNRPVQNLTINLENVLENSAELSFAWERTYVAVPLQLMTEQLILDKVDNLNNQHSSDYYMAAMYYLDTDKDLERAKEYIQRAIELREAPGGEPKFWVYTKQAEILLANQEKKAARKAAEKAMEMAAPRGADDYYVKQIATLLEELK